VVLCANLLFGVAPLGAATVCDPCVWVTNQRSNSISVMDSATNAVIANVPAGQNPQWLAAGPAGTRVYVSTHAESNDGLVTVIDTSTYKIVANIPVGKNPTGLVVNPGGTRLYVLNSGDNTMSIIDTGTNAIVGQPVPVGAGPYDVVVSPDGKQLYVSAESAGAIQVLDAANGRQIGPLIRTGNAPAGLALNPAGTRLYFANFVRSTVAVIDLQAGRILTMIPAGAGAIAVTRDPTGKNLYVADFGGGQGNSVSVIDTARNTVRSRIIVGTSPHALAMNSAGTALYVTNQRSDNVSVVDPSTNAVVATTPVDASPVGVAVVYAGTTTPPPMSSHIASAVNGRPVFDPGGTTTVFPNSTIQFTVRVPNIAAGSPAEVRYYLNPNLQFVNASVGTQTTPCQAATFRDPLPNGVQGEASSLRCSLTDGSKWLIITAKVIGVHAPRDDPYAAVACFPPTFTNCVPVRVSIVTKVRTPSLGTLGAQRTALILVNAPGAPPHPYANKAATASVFYASANPGSAQSFFFQASYGLMRITGANPAADGTAADIYGPYTAPNQSCGPDAIGLADPDIDYRRYDRVVVLTNNPDCTGGFSPGALTYQTAEGPRKLGLATINNAGFGDTNFGGKIGFETLHEYGHGLGLQHAGAWYCGNVSVAANGCFGNQRFEPLDVVSQGGNYAHPNSVHKEVLGWLESGRVFPVWTSGTYTINAYEDGLENVKVLKIPRKLRALGASGSPASGYYYLSYRRPSAPWDGWTANAPSFTNGVAIHMDEAGSGFDTALLDATPASIAGFNDVSDGALLINQTFTDPLAMITISVTAVTPASVQVAVTIAARTTRYVQAAIFPDVGSDLAAADAGSVTGGGSHSALAIVQTVQLSATAQPGWAFKDWLRFTPSSSQQVSQANPYRFPAPDDRVLWGRFKAAPPPNDNFAAATPIANLPFQVRLYTAGATSETGEPYPVNNCGAGTPNGWTIWYTYTPATNQKVTIDTVGSDNAIDIGVYTGNTINTLTAVPAGCSVWTIQQTAHVTFAAVAGTTYRIQLDTHGANTVVTFMLAPANDDFAAATQVTTLPTQSPAIMRATSIEMNEPQPPCFFSGINLSVWYKYTPATSGSLTVSAAYGGPQSTSTSPIIAVYTGGALGNLTAVPGGCNWQPNSGRPDLTVSVMAGTTYWIQIGVSRSWLLDPNVPTTITFQ